MSGPLQVRTAARKAVRALPRWMRAGVILSTPYEGGKAVEGELLQCCHCQFTKLYEVGDELKWQFCNRCRNFHCPAPLCIHCVPVRQQNDNLRSGRPRYHQRIIVSVGSKLPEA